MVDQTRTKVQLIEELEALRSRLAELQAEHAGCMLAVKTLHENVERYRMLLDESSDPIFTFYPDGTYRYVNQAFAEGVGLRVEDIINRKIWDVFSKEEADKRYAVLNWVFTNGVTKVFDVRVPRPEGDRFYITTVKPVLDESGVVKSVICISKEITERKKVETELLHLSTHDILTGLYNRNFFEVELARLQNSRLFPVSIVIIDLDNLKATNDRWGHSRGDEIIRQAAELVRRSFREEDIAARIGGDEFAVLLPETDQNAAEAVVDRLRGNQTSAEFDSLCLSIGVATGEAGCNLMDVLRSADTSMYREKMSRKANGAG